MSRLLEEVQLGKPFVIAKAGRPIARVTDIDTPDTEQTGHVGFLSGQIQVPKDFDRMGEKKIFQCINTIKSWKKNQ